MSVPGVGLENCLHNCTQLFLAEGILIVDPEGVIVLAGAGKDGSSKSHPGCFTPPSIRHQPTPCKASHRSLLKQSFVSLLRSLLNNQKFTDTFPPNPLKFET